MLAPLLIAAIAIAAAIAATVFLAPAAPIEAPIETPPVEIVASTTLPVSSSTTLLREAPTEKSRASTTTTAATPPTPKPTAPVPAPPTQSVQPAISTTPPPSIPAAATTTPTPTPPLTAAQANTLVRNAIVNIQCSATHQTLASASGSGVIIDPRGIILTNAHIGQYFLLADYPTKGAIDCVIRTGSPAYPRYRAELVYLSPSWVRDNAAEMASDDPTGTGERDYAFLRITGTIDGSALPAFSFLVPETDAPELGTPVVAAGYPADFLGSIAAERDLYLTSSLATVEDIYTFSASNTPDLISVGGTVLAQRGSSGGAVASPNGTLIGIVVTTTEASTTAGRILNAITVGHVERSLREETGRSVDQLLGGDVAVTAREFANVLAPALAAALVSALSNR